MQRARSSAPFPSRMLSDFACLRKHPQALPTGANRHRRGTAPVAPPGPLNPTFGGNLACLFTMREALAVCETAAAPNLRVAIDVHHVWRDAGLAQSLAGAAPGRRIGRHLHGWLENTSDMLPDRGMMGNGVGDPHAIRGAVENAGYDGPCGVEAFPVEDLWRRDPDEVLDVVAERFQAICRSGRRQGRRPLRQRLASRTGAGRRALDHACLTS